MEKKYVYTLIALLILILAGVSHAAVKTVLLKIDDNNYWDASGIQTNQNVILQENSKVCLDGATCNHYIYYNGSAVVIT